MQILTQEFGSKPGGKGSKGKKANSEKDWCKKCGKITNPPHWANSCPENSSSSAQAVLTSTPLSTSSEVAPVFAARDQTKDFLTNVTKLNVPLQLATAGGDLTVDVIGDLLCGGIVSWMCVQSPALSQSLQHCQK